MKQVVSLRSLEAVVPLMLIAAVVQMRSHEQGLFQVGRGPGLIFFGGPQHGRGALRGECAPPWLAREHFFRILECRK